MARFSLPMRHAAVALAALICAWAATSAQASTTRHSATPCHKRAVGHHRRQRCNHGKHPARAREVRELVWEVPAGQNRRISGEVLELVTEGDSAVERPAGSEGKREAEEEAQEAREEAAEAAKERAEEQS
jgi:hypothetical protein